MLVTVVPATSRHLDAICALLRTVKADRDPHPTAVESIQPGYYCRVAVEEEDRVVAWLWGRPLFGGESWELKWIIVDPTHQRSGVGWQLVRAFEEWCVAHGVLTVWLMTGDELGQTSLRGVDIFDDPLGRVRALELTGDHPIRFYRKLGYQLVGVIPDANGFGVPEYLMARRVADSPCRDSTGSAPTG